MREELGRDREAERDTKGEEAASFSFLSHVWDVLAVEISSMYIEGGKRGSLGG